MLFIYFVREMSWSRCVLSRQSLRILGSPGRKECVGPSSYSSSWEESRTSQNPQQYFPKPHKELGSDVRVSVALGYQGSRLDPARPQISAPHSTLTWTYEMGRPFTSLLRKISKISPSVV